MCVANQCPDQFVMALLVGIFPTGKYALMCIVPSLVIQFDILILFAVLIKNEYISKFILHSCCSSFLIC